MNILEFQERKKANKKITMVTCYDYWSAKIIAETPIDCILVGDTAAMVMHGFDTTLPATIDQMVVHTQAVVRGAKEKWIIADLPFLSYRKSLDVSMSAVEKLMQAGAHAVKLEGAHGNLDLIRHIVDSGIPVMGHLGLTPQSLHQLGGMKVQGKQQEQALYLLEQAESLQAAGCFSVVLECIPSVLAKQITDTLHIPTIGIGAGPHTSGQVLVLHDLLGFNAAFKPKFLKTYMNGFEAVKEALNTYCSEVTEGQFPDESQHSYL
jgi:3-methyl-2-oxobutanoate hydroxymethyltransferase